MGTDFFRTGKETVIDNNSRFAGEFITPAQATAVDAIDMAGYQAAADPGCKFNITIPESAGGYAALATAANAIDMAGYQAAADPGCKFTIAIPTSAGGSGTTITIKFDISSAGSPSSAGANHITIGTAGSSDAANGALVVKAINGTADSRITYGNVSGDGSSGTGVQGITAAEGAANTKVTLTMSDGGSTGNISGAIAHGAGTVNLVDVTAFTGGAESTQVTIKFDISSAGSPTSAGADHITIGTAGSSDSANAALVVKAVNGTADSRITYGNSSGPASSGTGVQGITAAQGSGATKVTLKITKVGTEGNISSAVAHGGGTVNLVDVTAFSGGTISDTTLFRFGVRGPANIRNRNEAYKVTVGKTSVS